MLDISISGIPSVQWHLRHVWTSRSVAAKVHIGRLRMQTMTTLYWTVPLDMHERSSHTDCTLCRRIIQTPSYVPNINFLLLICLALVPTKRIATIQLWSHENKLVCYHSSRWPRWCRCITTSMKVTQVTETMRGLSLIRENHFSNYTLPKMAFLIVTDSCGNFHYAHSYDRYENTREKNQ